MQNNSILISGAGIAGPTLAYWLVQHGFEPTVVEVAPRLRTGGYAIDFWGLGYDIAERMGLLPELKRRSYLVREVRFVDRRGRRVGGFGVDVFRRMTGGRYINLPRTALVESIYAAIENRCEIVFGDSIRVIEDTPDGVNIEFENAGPRRFDLLVGADGLHSGVRQLAFGSEDRSERYLGYAVAAFEARGYRQRDEGVYVSFGWPGTQVGRFTLRDDRTLFLIVFRAERSHIVAAHDRDAQNALLHRELAHRGWECARILDALDRSEHLYFDVVSQIHMDRWSRERVVLVGDAGFAPSLLAGQGSALAMTAAYVLAGELSAAQGGHEQAFARYEAVLREFIDGKLRAAEQFAGSFVPTTRYGLFLRNQLSKTLCLPYVADLLIGRGLLDRLTLPDYRVAKADQSG